MTKSLVVGGVFFALVIILGAYLLTRNNIRNDLTVQKNKLQSDLSILEKKLSKERDTLKIMTDNFRNSSALTVDVQDQMKKGSNIVSQTDFMFIDPNGLNPELIVKNLPTIILINKERKNINL